MAEDFARWLDILSLGQYAQTFADSAIDLETVADLSDDNLTGLGIPLGLRRKLQAAVEALVGDGASPDQDQARQSLRQIQPKPQSQEPCPLIRGCWCSH